MAELLQSNQTKNDQHIIQYLFEQKNHTLKNSNLPQTATFVKIWRFSPIRLGGQVAYTHLNPCPQIATCLVKTTDAISDHIVFMNKNFCGFCRRTPKEPLQLSCKHLLCLNCAEFIQVLDAQSHIQKKFNLSCPFCQKQTHTYNIKNLQLSTQASSQKKISSPHSNRKKMYFHHQDSSQQHALSCETSPQAHRTSLVTPEDDEYEDRIISANEKNRNKSQSTETLERQTSSLSNFEESAWHDAVRSTVDQTRPQIVGKKIPTLQERRDLLKKNRTISGDTSDQKSKDLFQLTAQNWQQIRQQPQNVHQSNSFANDTSISFDLVLSPQEITSQIPSHTQSGGKASKSEEKQKLKQNSGRKSQQQPILSEPSCISHRQQLQLFCRTCSKALCVNCVYAERQHQHCVVLPINQCFELIKRQSTAARHSVVAKQSVLQSQVLIHKQQKAQYLQQHTKLENEIDECSENLIQQIKLHQDHLKKQLQQVFDARIAECTKHIDRISDTLRKIADAQYLDKLLAISYSVKHPELYQFASYTSLNNSLQQIKEIFTAKEESNTQQFNTSSVRIAVVFKELKDQISKHFKLETKEELNGSIQSPEKNNIKNSNCPLPYTSSSQSKKKNSYKQLFTSRKQSAEKQQRSHSQASSRRASLSKEQSARKYSTSKSPLKECSTNLASLF